MIRKKQSIENSLLLFYVLPATRHPWKRPAGMKVKKFFRGKMDGWLDGMVLPWTNEMKVTLDGIVSARGQSNSLF